MGKTSKALGKAGYSLDGQPQSAPEIRTVEVESSIVETEEIITEDSFARDKVISLRGPQPATVPSPVWDERLTKVVGFTNRTAESFRVLRSKILLPQDGTPPPRTIMVTSALPREGKTFVSANLGIALAQGLDQYALVVDCDLRAPSLAPLFGISSERGLAGYLQDGTDLAALLQKTSMEKLSILPSGTPPVNPAELLGSSRMQNLVEELATRYPDRYVIFDTPPLEVASESQVLSQAVDGVVIVVRQGESDKSLIEKFISDIGKDKIIGVIFNGHKSNFISTRLVNKSHYYYGNYYNKKTE
ncbi:polysaccharide biosynthesis tyrosine autokinase [Desulfocastanea catecholica]